LSVLAAVTLCLGETGSGTSPEGPLDIRARAGGGPSLTFDANLHDADGNGICEGGEEVRLVVAVRNSGKGGAQGVRVVLSGSSALVGWLGREAIVGALGAGASRSETLSVPLPPSVESEEGTRLVVRVKEARDEWSCLDSVVFPVAIQPRRGTGETKVTYVDVDIVPEQRQEDPNAVAVVIGVSDYREAGVPAVANAERDARVVEGYLRNVCGVKAANMTALYGRLAGSGDLREAFEKLPDKVKPGSTVYIYFAGHGTPVGKEGRPMLVPYDATASSETKLYPVADIVRAADNWAAKRTLVMLDACFAGTDRVLYAAGERPAVRPDLAALGQGSKCVVLTASAADQTANDLPEVRHGLFTYYLLKALKGDGDADADGWVTMKELADYVRQNVSEEAAEKLGREQVPTLLPEGVERTGAGWRVGKSR
jgi:hypothetical protein